MKTVDDWVKVEYRNYGLLDRYTGWGVFLRETDKSQMIVFDGLRKREMAEGFAERIKKSITDFAKEVEAGLATYE